MEGVGCKATVARLHSVGVSESFCRFAAPNHRWIQTERQVLITGSSQQQRRPAAVPIAVPVPERRAQAEGRPSGEGPPQQREQRERGERGARREKRTRDRPPQSGETAPHEGSQAPAESRQAPRATAEAGGPPPQEQSGGGPPGAHRRGSRRGGGGQRGERPGGQGPPNAEAEGASKAVDAPPGTPPFSANRAFSRRASLKAII